MEARLINIRRAFLYTYSTKGRFGTTCLFHCKGFHLAAMAAQHE